MSIHKWSEPECYLYIFHRFNNFNKKKVNNFAAVYNEVRAMKSACGSAHLKTILATGELKSLNNVYKVRLSLDFTSSLAEGVGIQWASG